MCFWLLPLPPLQSPTAVDWLQWESEFTKQTWRESWRASTEIKEVMCNILVRGHGVPRHLQVAKEYSFKSSPPHLCSRWAPKEVGLLELGCLAVAAQPLSVAGSMHSIHSHLSPLPAWHRNSSAAAGPVKPSVHTPCPGAIPPQHFFPTRTLRIPLLLYY